MKTAIALLVVCSLTACEVVKPGETTNVVVDGIGVSVYPNLNQPGAWGAAPQFSERFKLSYAAQTAKNIRAIEMVSKCAVVQGTVETTSAGTTMAFVNC